MRQFAKDIVDKADVDSGSVRIGALVYSTVVQTQFYLDDYATKDDIKAAIDKFPYIYGSTNTAGALKEMREKLFDQQRGDRRGVDNVAFIVTDGTSNANRRTIPEARKVRAKGIKVYAIGIGLKYTTELEDMAYENKTDYVFPVKTFDELANLTETIFGGDEECDRDFPPVANSGDDVEIMLPIDKVTLNRNKSSDDIQIVAYPWEVVSGDSIQLADEESVTPTAMGLNAGTYTLILTVFDELDQYDEDEVNINKVTDACDDVTIKLPTEEETLDGMLLHINCC
ncbi:dyslexia-associated protein KIAA0319-like protein [Mercenaria mercenaria]|uniref:dyslexia-associated protein KIAA0319-like protein n=1 Tax=Mercenaria mercenaria TaxID=6596 RepID=UPI00234F1118|nr:dyslexia-associated protein KIAA0319-like protein [Mercenaria mercenaria]